jgi:hypothetical protein
VHVTGQGEMLRGYLALKSFRKDLLRVKSPGDLSFMSVFDTTAPPRDSARIAMALREPRKLAIVADFTLRIDRGNYYRNRPDANTEFYTEEGEAVVAHLDQRTGDQWAVGFVRIPGGVAFFRTQPFVPARGSLTFTPHTGAQHIVQQVGERLIWEPGRGWFPLQLFTGGTSKVPAIGLESGTLFPIRGRELNGYLTQGRTSTSLLQQSGSSLSGSESWSGQLTGEMGALARRHSASWCTTSAPARRRNGRSTRSACHPPTCRRSSCSARPVVCAGRWSRAAATSRPTATSRGSSG